MQEKAGPKTTVFGLQSYLKRSVFTGQFDFMIAFRTHKHKKVLFVFLIPRKTFSVQLLGWKEFLLFWTLSQRNSNIQSILKKQEHRIEPINSHSSAGRQEGELKGILSLVSSGPHIHGRANRHSWPPQATEKVNSMPLMRYWEVYKSCLRSMWPSQQARKILEAALRTASHDGPLQLGWG